MATNKRWTLLTVVLSLMSAWAVGCAGADDGQPASASPAADDASGAGEITLANPRGTPPVAVRLSTKLSESQIIGILGTANMDVIQASRLATTKESPVQIREFAEQMVTDHNKSNEQLALLSSSLSLAPIPSSISVQLQAKAKENLALLQQETGAKFDRLYIDTQVAAHANLLALLNSKLLPNAVSPALREELLNIRALEKQHLDEAIKLQTALGPPTLGATGSNG